MHPTPVQQHPSSNHGPAAAHQSQALDLGRVLVRALKRGGGQAAQPLRRDVLLPRQGRHAPLKLTRQRVVRLDDRMSSPVQCLVAGHAEKLHEALPFCSVAEL